MFQPYLSLKLCGLTVGPQLTDGSLRRLTWEPLSLTVITLVSTPATGGTMRGGRALIWAAS